MPVPTLKRDPLEQVFARRAAAAPEAPLVVSPTRRATVGEVAGLARAASSALAGASLHPGRVVALCAPNGTGFLAGLLALRRAGLVALLVEHRTPAEVLDRIGARFGAAGVLRCDAAWPTGVGDFALDLRGEWDGARQGVCDAAVIKLSSGSSGVPRGVATPMEALLADDEALRGTMGIGAQDRLLATVPFPHSYGLSSLVIPALAAGLVLVVPDRTGPVAPLEAARAADATVFPTVPAFVTALTKMSSPPALPTSVRCVITAGALIRPEVAAAFRERYGRAVHVFYGASECGGIAFDRRGGAAERGTVGTPIRGVSLRLEPVEGAAEHRVVVESPAVATGYLPEGTDQLGRGRYVTDDLARWEGGELRLIGRLGSVINIKGKKVDPREVESVLAALPRVEEVRVVGAPSSADAEPVLRAVIACAQGALSATDVIDWCRERLHDYKVPRSIVFVPELPRTERGKVDRAALIGLGSAHGLVTTTDG